MILDNTDGTSFPTRTMERDDFSFDPDTGMLRLKGESPREYRLTIDGLVEIPVHLSYRRLRELPLVRQVSDFHCVEGWTVPDVKWTGIRFTDLLTLVKPSTNAGYVTFHSLGKTISAPSGQGHYVEGFPLSDLLDPKQEILLALDMDDEPLSMDRGAPLRVIAPYRQAYKSIKFVYRVEFTDSIQPGWWTLANPIYDIEAQVPASRIRKR